MTDIYVSGTNTLSGEILFDPTFDNLTSWVTNDWTVTGGQAVASGTTGNLTDNGSPAITDNKVHRVIYEIAEYTSGTFSALIGGTPADGAKAQNFVATGEVPQTYAIDEESNTIATVGFNAGNALTAKFNSLSIREHLTSGAGTSDIPYVGLFNNDYSILAPGNTLYIGGDVNSSTLRLDNINGTAAEPITIKGQSDLVWTNNDPAYQSLSISGIVLNNCSYIVIEDIHVTGDMEQVSNYLDVWTGQGVRVDDGNDHITVRNCSFNHFFSGVDISQEKNITTPNTYIDVLNCSFDGNENRAIGLQSNYSSVVGCSIINTGSKAFSDSSAMVLQGGGCTVTNNYFDNSGPIGVDGDFNLSIDGYSAEDINHGLPTYVYGNMFKKNNTGCVCIYNGSEVYFYNNIIDGFNLNDVGGATVGKFSAVRFGRGSSSAGDTDDSAKIFNNVFINGGGVAANCSALTFGFGQIGIGFLNVYNNVFIDCVQYLNGDDSSLADMGNITFDNNLYYQADGIYTDHWNMASILADADNFDTLAEWQGSSLSPDANGLVIDPGLDANYMPSMNSPIVGAGTTPLSNFDAYSRAHTGTGNHIGAVWPYVETNKNRRKL